MASENSVLTNINILYSALLTGLNMISAASVGRNDTVVTVGSAATFTCTANAECSLPRVDWAFKAVDKGHFQYLHCKPFSLLEFIRPDCTIALSNNNRTSSLTVNNVQLTDAALYRCYLCWSRFSNWSTVTMTVTESKGCYWNVSSPDYSVNESDVIEIDCEVLYASRWWRPAIQCLPEIPADVVSNNVTNHHSPNASVMYRKIVTVTSRLNNVTFDCHVSFKSTSNSSSRNLNAPVDIHLWTSPVIKVKYASMTEENSEYFTAFIVMSSLLTISLFTLIGLTVGILCIKGKSPCMKDRTYEQPEMSTREVVQSVYTELNHPEYLEIIA